MLTTVLGTTFAKVVNAVGKRLVRAAPGGNVVIRVVLESARLVKAFGRVVLAGVLRKIDVLPAGTVVGQLAPLVKLVKRVGRMVLMTKVLAAGTVVGKPEEAEVLGRLVAGKLLLGVLI